METFLILLEDELLTMAFCFTLVFVAGICLGYLNGVVDGKTAPPKYTPGGGFEAYQPTKDRTTTPPRRSEDLDDFEKEYRAEVLGNYKHAPPPPRNGFGKPKTGPDDWKI